MCRFSFLQWSSGKWKPEEGKERGQIMHGERDSVKDSARRERICMCRVRGGLNGGECGKEVCEKESDVAKKA